MKLLKRIAAVATLFTAACGSAHAALITHTVDPFPFAVVTLYTPYTYTHDLRSQLLPGMRINSADLVVSLQDLTDILVDMPETLNLGFDGTPGGTVQNVPRVNTDYRFDIATSLLDDGLLEVTITAGCNLRVAGICTLPQDVIFRQSTLTADVTPPTPAPVPEPASILTLGLGLLGLAAARRRR